MQLTRPMRDIMQSTPGFEGGPGTLGDARENSLGRGELGEITGHCTRGMVLCCGTMGTCIPSKCLCYPKSSKLPDNRTQRAALFPSEL